MSLFYRLPACFIVLLSIAVACNSGNDKNKEHPATFDKGSFGYDRQFLGQHTKHLIELSSPEDAKLLLSADYQGRVMTSSAAGDRGRSYGWINYALIGSGKWNSQFNPVGGEERFWMGPEGGQYSLYFAPHDSFTIPHWKVPPVIDTSTYEVTSATDTSAQFHKEATLVNYAGTHFQVSIHRNVKLLNRPALEQLLKMRIPSGLKLVGYASTTSLTNEGPDDWSKDKGLISIWLLGMMTPSPNTKVVLPFHPVPEPRKFITDDYFGKIPANRLALKDSMLYLRCDGKMRGKVGLSPAIAKPIAGSMDFDHNVLTLLLFPVNPSGDYVNSKWEWQQQPYKGDVVNAYNDGPLATGGQLGPFYEIESSSAVKPLKKGQQLEYGQVTLHIQGDYATLKELARTLLGTDLDDLKKW